MNYPKFLFAAIAATAVMTAFLLFAPFLGLPKMDVGQILGTLFGGKEAAGWVMHFVIGVIFALVYVLFINKMLPVENNISRGAIYGIFVFILTEVLFTLINFSGYLKWEIKENMALMIFGNALACLIYGAVLGSFYREKS